MSFRRNIAATLLLMACIVWAPAADAAKRVALVIGNDTYATLPDLNNSRTDAKGMAAKLRSLGFDVILKQDVSRRGLFRALADFEGRLKDADVGLVFYAGHGIQADGTNYLVPSDAKIEIEDDLRYEGIKADDFLEVMERAGTPLNIVILDACRDNPLPRRTRSAVRGLTVPVIPKGIKGTAIVYSAAPGQTAQDGPKGGHGVFTGQLLKVLDRPGLTLERVFKETATLVAAATNGRQDPWINSSVKGDFFFREGKATESSASGQTPEMLFWQSIKDSDDPDDYADYLSQYPRGTFAKLAKRRVEKLKRTKVAVARPPKASTRPKATPAVGVYPKRYKPGDTFRDCTYCPEMVVIPPGSFRMGDLSGIGKANERPAHDVRIGYSFAVGRYEVTQEEWKDVMGTANPSRIRGHRYPVEQVSWKMAKDFVRRLSAKSGKEYRLLSEAEWEYMARAGSTSKYPFGNSERALCAHANGADQSTDYDLRNKSCSDGYGKTTSPVGSFAANEFGVHDTVGNVWEWVEDCWHGSYSGAPSDGSAWTSGGGCTNRVLRGGAWNDGPGNLPSAYRNWFGPSKRYLTNGLRVARTLLDGKASSPQLQKASLPPPSIQIEEMDATYVVVKTSNLRVKPSAQSKKVGQLAIDTGVSVTGKVKGKKWYRIAHAGASAYVFAPLIKQIDPQELKDWRHIKWSEENLAPATNRTLLKVFVRSYPKGHFLERARKRLEMIKPPAAVDTFRDCPECPEMVVIPPGTFLMGDLSGNGSKDEKPVHEVRIGYSFAVGKFEVTQDEWVAVMGSNPSKTKGGRIPVEQVSWNLAKAYVRKLAAKTGKEYRLLSESEWEYMARAGSHTKYHWGDLIDGSMANYGEGIGSSTRVGKYWPNAFGVHDTAGNAWEWVEDCWNDNYSGAPSNGSAWTSRGNCDNRVLRGGSWSNIQWGLRSAFRNRYDATERALNYGFRIARTLSR